ncbi:MAG: hypothetical protein JSV16_16620 [Candidatus Hydrogenedentota bacterium]|nr:MAG: hypothetical protein JSV16_16620 [Candidatus Hydrogenedentota bacterium]
MSKTDLGCVAYAFLDIPRSKQKLVVKQLRIRMKAALVSLFKHAQVYPRPSFKNVLSETHFYLETASYHKAYFAIKESVMYTSNATGSSRGDPWPNVGAPLGEGSQTTFHSSKSKLYRRG